MYLVTIMLSGLPFCVDTESTTPRHVDYNHKLSESFKNKVIRENSGVKTVYSLSNHVVILVVVVLQM